MLSDDTAPADTLTTPTIQERLDAQRAYVAAIEAYNRPDDAAELDIAQDHLRALEAIAAERDALRKELGYWKSVVEDPFLYWGQDNPPYVLYGDDEAGDLADAPEETGVGQ